MRNCLKESLLQSLKHLVVKIKNSLIYPRIKLTKGCPTLKLSLPCFPLTPFNGLALVWSFMICLALSGFSCLGEKSPSLLLQPTLYLLAHGIEQKRLERVKLRAGAVLPQNSQRSMLPSSEIDTRQNLEHHGWDWIYCWSPGPNPSFSSGAWFVITRSCRPAEFWDI